MPMTTRRSASVGELSPIERSSAPPVRSRLRRAAASSRFQPSPRSSVRFSVTVASCGGGNRPPGAGRTERDGQVTHLVGEELPSVPYQQQRADGVVDGRVRQVVVRGGADGGLG